jgi:nucleoside-diphosphate-sugar epimerase
MKTRIAITGAAGWLGRELAFRLIPRQDFEVLLLGRRSETLNLHGVKAQIHEWTDDLAASWAPEMVVHLAYTTRERLDSFGEDAFIAANLELRDRIEKMISLKGVRRLVHVSSGAAISGNQASPYGQLKKDDEEFYRCLGEATNTSVMTARAWSLSGRFCTKPSEFLFFDVLSQIARGMKTITLTAQGEVWRRYVDAGDYLETCVLASLEALCGSIDSTGDLIEAEDLVHQAAQICGCEVQISRPNRQNSASNSFYLSSNPAMESAMKELGIRRFTLDQQIRLGFLDTNLGCGPTK